MPGRPKASDISPRAAGLAMLVFGALALARMFVLVRLPPAHDPSAAEMTFAAAAFLSLSVGSVLTALGTHIFDEVEVSGRWAQRPMVEQEIPSASRKDGEESARPQTPRQDKIERAVVPLARLERARLATTDFESVASTIPPQGHGTAAMRLAGHEVRFKPRA